MEVFLHGPGGLMTTRPLTNPVYEYWKDKPSKFLFDYSWNLDTVWKNQCNTQHDNRTTLEIPAYADFLPHNWSQNQGERTIHICDYDNSVLFVEIDNRITIHHPDKFSTIETEREYNRPLTKFYSGVSCEIGNWQHKKYTKNIPLEDLILYTKKINDRKYIIDVVVKRETMVSHVDWNLCFEHSMIHEKEIFNMYRDETGDYYYRLHVRNENVINDLSTFTNVDLSFNINSQTYHDDKYVSLDTSNFKIHND